MVMITNKYTEDKLKSLLKDDGSKYLLGMEFRISDGTASASITVLGIPAPPDSDIPSMWAIEFHREFDSRIAHGVWTRIPSGVELLKWFNISFSGEQCLPEGLMLPQSCWFECLEPYMK
jgi:hypothetical protein